jgi:hypothetical protein
MKSFQGSALITDEGIKKHFIKFEPIEAIYELVWNGLDANCNSVHVKINHNGLDGLDSVLVVDDGDGIDIENIKNNFEKFNESSKKNDDDKHGSHGKGRLAFHKLSEKAVWYTKRKSYNAKITIESSAIKDYRGHYLSENEQHSSLVKFNSGTCVELSNFGRNNLPSDEVLIGKLSQEFGWYLALNKNRVVKLNGAVVPVPEHELHETKFTINENQFVAKVIRWNSRPGSEKSYNYLINSNNQVVKRELSKFNKKVDFHTSAYVFSTWIDGYEPDALEADQRYIDTPKIIREILKNVISFQRDIYKDYLRRYVDLEIEKYDENGYFPTYSKFESGYASWRKNNTKKILREIYIADPTIFNRLNAKPAKILIRLLDKILVSNENDTLIEVLEGVLDLDSDNLTRLASQIKMTTLENIISTIETLQKRQMAIHQLREVMQNRFAEILETPDLQKIIENNTWLFGPQYTTLGAEEDTFTKIAKNLRDKIKDIDVVSDKDVAEGANVEGINKQVDLFLARKVPSFDGFGNKIFKCVIVEIKRPGISLNKNHLQQLDGYAEIISKHPEFTSDKMRFELILIGRKISKDDYQIRQRKKNLKSKSEFGLVTDDDKIKCYVKDWFTIFDEFDLSNDYLLQTLNTKLEDLSDVSTTDLVVELQTEIKGAAPISA